MTLLVSRTGDVTWAPAGARAALQRFLSFYLEHFERGDRGWFTVGITVALDDGRPAIAALTKAGVTVSESDARAHANWNSTDSDSLIALLEGLLALDERVFEGAVLQVSAIDVRWRAAPPLQGTASMTREGSGRAGGYVLAKATVDDAALHPALRAFAALSASTGVAFPDERVRDEFVAAVGRVATAIGPRWAADPPLVQARDADGAGFDRVLERIEGTSRNPFVDCGFLYPPVNRWPATEARVPFAKLFEEHVVDVLGGWSRDRKAAAIWSRPVLPGWREVLFVENARGGNCLFVSLSLRAESARDRDAEKGIARIGVEAWFRPLATFDSFGLAYRSADDLRSLFARLTPTLRDGFVLLREELTRSASTDL